LKGLAPPAPLDQLGEPLHLGRIEGLGSPYLHWLEAGGHRQQTHRLVTGKPAGRDQLDCSHRPESEGDKTASPGGQMPQSPKRIGGEQLVDAIIDRIKRAVTLKAGVYEEIGNDPQATGQAIIVTVAAALIGGLGDLIRGRFGGWILSGIYAIVGLAIGAGILFLISRLFKGQGAYISLFRGLGYAYAPQALAVIPVVGAFVGGIWSLILAIRTVKETQRVSDGAAVAVVLIPAIVIGFIIFIFVVLLSVAMFGLLSNNS
jgi:hypothetical protein